MADPTGVKIVTASLYTGDDQPFTYKPDTSADTSGIPLVNWAVELRIAKGRAEVATVPPVAFLTIPMTFDANNNQFNCVITKEQTLTMKQQGRWTGDVWRTNVNNCRLLVRLLLTVYFGVGAANP